MSHQAMSRQFRWLENHTIAFAQVLGDAYPEDIISLYTDLTRFANEHQSRLLLVDFTHSRMDFEILVIRDLVSRVGVITQKRKVARIFPQADFRQYIVEDLASQAGFPIRNFCDQNSAVQWLKSGDNTTFAKPLAYDSV